MDRRCEFVKHHVSLCSHFKFEREACLEVKDWVKYHPHGCIVSPDGSDCWTDKNVEIGMTEAVAKQFATQKFYDWAFSGIGPLPDWHSLFGHLWEKEKRELSWYAIMLYWMAQYEKQERKKAALAKRKEEKRKSKQKKKDRENSDDEDEESDEDNSYYEEDVTEEEEWKNAQSEYLKVGITME